MCMCRCVSVCISVCCICIFVCVCICIALCCVFMCECALVLGQPALLSLCVSCILAVARPSSPGLLFHSEKINTANKARVCYLHRSPLPLWIFAWHRSTHLFPPPAPSVSEAIALRLTPSARSALPVPHSRHRFTVFFFFRFLFLRFSSLFIVFVPLLWQRPQESGRRDFGGRWRALIMEIDLK